MNNFYTNQTLPRVVVERGGSTMTALVVKQISLIRSRVPPALQDSKAAAALRLLSVIRVGSEKLLFLPH